MSKKTSEAAWKDYLPEVYRWADSVQWVDGVSSSGINIVPVRAKATDGDSTKIKRDVLCATAMPKAMKDEILKNWTNAGWHGKSGSLHTVLDSGEAFLLVPVSQVQTTSVQISRQFGIDAAKAAKDYHPNQIVISADNSFVPASMFDGLGMGFYDGGLFKGQRPSKAPETLPKKIGFYNGKAKAADLTLARELVKATALTRMLQDAPANWLTPERFGNIAKDVAKELGLTCTLLGPKELESLGAGSFLSVAAGSNLEPRLIAIELGAKTAKETIALIGKGLTFDSGGTSLKPSLGMGEMKYDMSGGAAVIGTAYYLAKQKLDKRVVCIVGAVENMIGPNATRPGDVVTAMNGKTIDVQNTDAEGRLVLADLMHYAITKYKPKIMIDIATLTGAVLHALGHAGAAVMSNDQATADLVLKTSRDAGEPFWQLPLWPELEKETKGDCSDLQNIAKPSVQAGTIMGGLFLAEFAGETKWAHLDIAGTGWGCKATGFPGAGGSSFGLRTLAALCLKS